MSTVHVRRRLRRALNSAVEIGNELHVRSKLSRIKDNLRIVVVDTARHPNITVKDIANIIHYVLDNGDNERECYGTIDHILETQDFLVLLEELEKMLEG
jgi:nucleoside-diphosphate-sugar epimerase